MIGFTGNHVSFSQLTQIEQCPYSYYLVRVAGVAPKENAFAQAGSFVHALLARWAKGEISIQDLPGLWSDGYGQAVTELFPAYLETKGYRQKLHDSILAYFREFTGFPGYEIVAAEQAFTSGLSGEPFTGVIDLILRSEDTGEFILVDHKSSSLSAFKHSREKMYRQLLLYSKYLADHFGVFPVRLCFNLFKEHAWDEQPYAPQDYVEAVQWAERNIQEIKSKELPEWLELRPEKFYCTQLCAAREVCPYGNPQYHQKEGIRNRNRQPESTAA